MFQHKRMAVTVGLALFVLLILAASVVLRPMFGYPRPINYARWLLWSRSYKTEVLVQPSSANGELKHIEWDGWGWAGMDTTVYLAFDPSDSLSQAASSLQPGKYSGIPCEVFLVRRLESRWYTVCFYTNYEWGRPRCR
jgi:hypothetical protein